MLKKKKKKLNDAKTELLVFCSSKKGGKLKVAKQSKFRPPRSCMQYLTGYMSAELSPGTRLHFSAVYKSSTAVSILTVFWRHYCIY